MKIILTRRIPNEEILRLNNSNKLNRDDLNNKIVLNLLDTTDIYTFHAFVIQVKWSWKWRKVLWTQQYYFFIHHLPTLGKLLWQQCKKFLTKKKSSTNK